MDNALCDLAVREAVKVIRVPVSITELLGTDYQSWSAEIQIDPVKFDDRWPYELADTDPDYNADVPRGYGMTRVEAVADLLRAMRRITWGIVSQPEPARFAIRMIAVAWSGTSLVVVDDPVLYTPRP